MTNLEYIKAFSKITVKSICDELHIDKSNLYRGNSSKANELKVIEKINQEIDELNKKYKEELNK